MRRTSSLMLPRARGFMVLQQFSPSLPPLEFFFFSFPSPVLVARASQVVFLPGWRTPTAALSPPIQIQVISLVNYGPPSLKRSSLTNTSPNPHQSCGGRSSSLALPFPFLLNIFPVELIRSCFHLHAFIMPALCLFAHRNILHLR